LEWHFFSKENFSDNISFLQLAAINAKRVTAESVTLFFITGGEKAIIKHLCSHKSLKNGLSQIRSYSG
jgi:hypothetical protein